MQIKRISLTDLPKYTPWAERLLGLEVFNRPTRNIQKIDAEYDKDKYTKLLDYILTNPGSSVSEIRELSMSDDFKKLNPMSGDIPFPISIQNNLYLVNRKEYIAIEKEVLYKCLAPYIEGVKTVLELGCGYGYNLDLAKHKWSDKTYVGGEYSQNGIKVGGLLGIKIFPFNWYDESWPIFDDLETPILVFTRQSIEQLPQAKNVIPTFMKYIDKITYIVHIEPVYELSESKNLLSLMRRSYTKINDYNQDLLTTLNEMKVNILVKDYDVLSANPLNAVSNITWAGMYK